MITTRKHDKTNQTDRRNASWPGPRHIILARLTDRREARRDAKAEDDNKHTTTTTNDNTINASNDNTHEHNDNT